MRLLYFFGTVFLLLFSPAQTRAQTVVPDTAVKLETMNELLRYEAWCAHGHECCQARCSCCPELHRQQAYDTFVSPEVKGIKRYTIIERYSIAQTNAAAPVQFIFKNAAGAITASYFGKWRYVYERNDSPPWKTQLRMDPHKGFKNGVAIVHDGNFDYSLVDETGKQLPIAFQSSSPFGKGLYKVSLIINNERVFGIADAQGNKRGPLKYRNIEPLRDGLARVNISRYGLYGFIDNTGKEVVPCLYSQAGPFVNDTCIVVADSGSVPINRKGERLLHREYHSMGRIDGGLYTVGHKGKYGIIDTKGNIVVPLEYDGMGMYADGLIPARRDKKWGFIDRTGKVVIPLIYHEVHAFSEGRAVVKAGADSRNALYGVIDKTGKMIVEPTYDELSVFLDGCSRARINRQGQGFIDRNGKEVIPCSYGLDYTHGDSTWFPFGRVILRDKTGRYFLADKKGREVLALGEYKAVNRVPGTGYGVSPSQYLRVVSKEDKMGLIDFKGKIIIPCIYDQLQLDSDSVLLVFSGKKIGFISLTGKELLPPQPISYPLSRFEDGIVELRADDGYSHFFIDRTGTKVVEPY